MLDGNAEYQTTVGTFFYMSPEVYLHQPYDKVIKTFRKNFPSTFNSIISFIVR